MKIHISNTFSIIPYLFPVKYNDFYEIYVDLLKFLLLEVIEKNIYFFEFVPYMHFVFQKSFISILL